MKAAAYQRGKLVIESNWKTIPTGSNTISLEGCIIKQPCDSYYD